MDTVVPGFGVRVTDKGAKSYFLNKRVPGVRNKTRRTIAPVGAVTLKDARQTAREWLEQITEGADPKAITRARNAQEAAEQGRGLSVVEDFIAERLPGQRKGNEVARDLRREFVNSWRNKGSTKSNRRTSRMSSGALHGARRIRPVTF